MVAFQAAATGCVDTVRHLLKHGAHIGLSGTMVGTALMAAGKFGNKDVAQLILEEAAARKVDNTLLDLNHDRDEGPSALMLAAEYGRLDTARYLLDNGAPYRVADPVLAGYEYEYEYDTDYERVTTTTALLKCVDGQERASYYAKELRYVRQDKDHHWCMMTANMTRGMFKHIGGDFEPSKLRGADLEYVKLITMLCDHDGGKMLDMSDECGRSPLILAVGAGRHDIVKIILDKLQHDPARFRTHLNNIYTACAPGGSALARAAANGDGTMVTFLLEKGASVNYPVGQSILNHKNKWRNIWHSRCILLPAP